MDSTVFIMRSAGICQTSMCPALLSTGGEYGVEGVVSATEGVFSRK